MTLKEFNQIPVGEWKCEQASEKCSPSAMATKMVRRDEDIFLYCDLHAPNNVQEKAVNIQPDYELRPENLPETVSQLKGPGVALLRSKLSSQFGVRLESTGARAAGAISRIVMQTLDVSPAKPCLISFEQFILTPFTGAGQFDLMEHDSNVDIFDAEGQVVGGVTIATKAGLTDGTTTNGWSRFSKPITSDKIYSVVFVPGTAGDGIFSINPRALIQLDPDQTPLPS